MEKMVLDHLGREVHIPRQAQRIVSLCPSITETLFDLGLGDRIIGRTHFCIHPADRVSEVKAVGGTKKLKYERLADLKPDLIIAEKEENTPEMVEKLSEDYPVYVTDIVDPDSCLRMIRDVGLITGSKSEGMKLADQVQEAFLRIKPLEEKRSVLYFIWRKPYMLAGQETFIDSVLSLCNFQNLARDLHGRYPAMEPEALALLKPDVILLSSEPYPFEEKHVEELSKLIPQVPIYLVDGEMFTWYGSRMLKAPQYLNTLREKISKDAPTHQI